FEMDSHKHTCPTCRAAFGAGIWDMTIGRGYFGVDTKTPADVQMRGLNLTQEAPSIADNAPWAGGSLRVVMRKFRESAKIGEYFFYIRVRLGVRATSEWRRGILRIQVRDGRGESSFVDLSWNKPQGRIQVPLGTDPAKTEVCVSVIA